MLCQLVLGIPSYFILIVKPTFSARTLGSLDKILLYTHISTSIGTLGD